MHANNARYAYHYSCPQTFCYDGINLLILRFRARSRDDIKQCPVDCWVVPSVSTDTTSSIRYAFYRLLSEGFHRAISHSLGHPMVTIGQYQRYFEWFSGKPCWVDNNGNVYEIPPAGYTRVYHSQQRQWAWNLNGAPFAWDTAAFPLQ